MAPLKQHVRGTAATFAACLLIAHFTLWPQSGSPARPFEFCLLCGTYGTTNLLLNALLFIPLGAALQQRRWHLSRALLFVLATTTIVELLQLIVIAGRSAALGDIVANSIGGAIGWTLAANHQALTRPGRQQGMVLGAAQATAMAGLVLLGGWLFQSSPTTQPLYGQVAPVLPERGAVDGVVTDPQLNGATLPEGPFSPSLTQATQNQLGANEIALSAKLAVRKEKRRAVLIVRLADSQEQELALLGLEGASAVFSVRTRASDALLFQPSVRILSVLRCDSCADGINHRNVMVAGARRGNSYEIAVTDSGTEKRASLKISGNMTWMAFTPAVGDATTTAQVTFWWLAVQALVLGFWLGHAFTGARSALYCFACGVAVAALTQWVLPVLMGTAYGAAAEWIAVTGGTLAGFGVAQLRRHLRLRETGVVT